MSEITVTLPKKEYDKLNEKICQLKEELLDLQNIVRKKQYFFKEMDNRTYRYYFRSLEPDEIAESFEAKYLEREKKYEDVINKQNTLISEKNGVIFELNERIKEYENFEKLVKEVPVKNHPTTLPTHTTTLYHQPKPKKKPWWKLF